MLTSADFTTMRADVADSLLDTCVIGVMGSASGVEPTAAYTYTANPVACGFAPMPSGEAGGDAPQVTMTDAVLRLALTETVTGDSRIKLTKRFGTTLTTPEYYAVIGEPKRGHTLFVCKLRRLTGGSAQ